MSWICFLVLIALVESRPQENDAYKVRCEDVEKSPGVWDFTCTPPSDEKITLSYEHTIQFNASSPKKERTHRVLNIAIPNYKILQTIQPEAFQGKSDPDSNITVNIMLLQPQIETRRNSQKFHKAPAKQSPPLSPQVNVNYPKLFQNNDTATQDSEEATVPDYDESSTGLPEIPNY